MSSNQNNNIPLILPIDLQTNQQEIWYHVINSVLNFVTASTSLATTLSYTPALYNEEPTIKTTPRSMLAKVCSEDVGLATPKRFMNNVFVDEDAEYFVCDFPWFMEELEHISKHRSPDPFQIIHLPRNIESVLRACSEPEYRPRMVYVTESETMADVREIVEEILNLRNSDVVTKLSPRSMSIHESDGMDDQENAIDLDDSVVEETQSDDENIAPKQVNLFLYEKGDSKQNPPPLPYKDESNFSFFYEDFTDSEESIHSNNLQENFEINEDPISKTVTDIFADVDENVESRNIQENIENKEEQVSEIVTDTFTNDEELSNLQEKLENNEDMMVTDSSCNDKAKFHSKNIQEKIGNNEEQVSVTDIFANDEENVDVSSTLQQIFENNGNPLFKNNSCDDNERIDSSTNIFNKQSLAQEIANAYKLLHEVHVEYSKNSCGLNFSGKSDFEELNEERVGTELQYEVSTEKELQFTEYTYDICSSGNIVINSSRMISNNPTIDQPNFVGQATKPPASRNPRFKMEDNFRKYDNHQLQTSKKSGTNSPTKNSIINPTNSNRKTPIKSTNELIETAKYLVQTAEKKIKKSTNDINRKTSMKTANAAAKTLKKSTGDIARSSTSAKQSIKAADRLVKSTDELVNATKVLVDKKVKKSTGDINRKQAIKPEATNELVKATKDSVVEADAKIKKIIGDINGKKSTKPADRILKSTKEFVKATKVLVDTADKRIKQSTRKQSTKPTNRINDLVKATKELVNAADIKIKKSIEETNRKQSTKPAHRLYKSTNELVKATKMLVHTADKRIKKSTGDIIYKTPDSVNKSTNELVQSTKDIVEAANRKIKKSIQDLNIQNNDLRVGGKNGLQNTKIKKNYHANSKTVHWTPHSKLENSIKAKIENGSMGLINGHPKLGHFVKHKIPQEKSVNRNRNLIVKDIINLPQLWNL